MASIPFWISILTRSIHQSNTSYQFNCFDALRGPSQNEVSDLPSYLRTRTSERPFQGMSVNSNLRTPFALLEFFISKTVERIVRKLLQWRRRPLRTIEWTKHRLKSGTSDLKRVAYLLTVIPVLTDLRGQEHRIISHVCELRMTKIVDWLRKK